MSSSAFSTILVLGFNFAVFARNFPIEQEADGQLGTYDVAIGNNGSVFVSSHTDGFIYRFSEADTLPDAPSASNRLNPTALSGGLSGLFLSKAQRLYAARLEQGDVVELDPVTGAVLREVATGISCASHLAQDPLSGDLFVSSVCENAVFRLPGFESVPGSVNPEAYCVSVNGPDGLGFGSDGTLYVAALDGLDAVTGTNSAQPGKSSSLVAGASFNGLAVQDGAAGLAPYLYACDSGGDLTRYDANVSGGNPTQIFLGGQRAEGLALDSKGNLFVTQSFGLAEIGLAGGPLIGPQPTATPTATLTPSITATA
ncbi:MAG: hypothetical protein ACREKE_00935, partial [bacterium]